MMGMTIGEGAQTSNDSSMPRNEPIQSTSGTGDTGAASENTKSTDQQSRKEQSDMGDIDVDLRGDDLKFVEYDLWFTKSDLETYLAEDKEVINYGTTEGDYKGAKKSRYLEDLKDDPGKRDQKWMDNNYPPQKYRVNEDGTQNNDGEYFNGLPTDDVDQFLKVDLRLVGRRPKDEKDESDRLKEINKTLTTGITVFPK